MGCQASSVQLLLGEGSLVLEFVAAITPKSVAMLIFVSQHGNGSKAYLAGSVAPFNLLKVSIKKPADGLGMNVLLDTRRIIR